MNNDRPSWSYEAKGSKGDVVAFHLVLPDGQDKKGYGKWKGVCGHTAKRWISGDPSVQNDWGKVCNDCLESDDWTEAEVARERKAEWQESADGEASGALPSSLVAKPKPEAKKPTLPEILFEGTESLPVKLTEDELLDLGQQLAQVESEVKAHEEHATSVKAGLKHREAQLDAQRAEVASKIRAKSEYRDVRVQTTADYKKGIATTVRLDLMQKVRDRALSIAERQGTLDLDLGADEDEAA
jgi:hypothetical protein